MHRRIWLASALLMLLLAPPASAEVRRASSSGGETGTCTSAEPPCSLKRAVETVANPGDEVILAAGTYTVSSAVNANKRSTFTGRRARHARGSRARALACSP